MPGDAAAEGRPHTGENYRYKRIWGLTPFQGAHPSVMSERIRSKGWHWDYQAAPWEWQWKDLKRVALDLFERVTGRRLFEYRSYIWVRD